MAGALAWVLASWGFGLYVAAFGRYDMTYGSLGSAMILLTWLYLSGFIALAGGEVNALLDQVRGPHKAALARHRPRRVGAPQRVPVNPS